MSDKTFTEKEIETQCFRRIRESEHGVIFELLTHQLVITQDDARYGLQTICLEPEEIDELRDFLTHLDEWAKVNE